VSKGRWKSLKLEFAAAALAGFSILGAGCASADSLNLPEGIAARATPAEQQELKKQVKLFKNVLGIAQMHAVIAHSHRDLADAALKAIVKKADPDADYINLAGRESELLLSLEAQEEKNALLAMHILGMAKRHATEDHSYTELMAVGMNAMLQSIDPHSNYFPPSVWHQMQEDIKGEFAGIGIELRNDRKKGLIVGKILDGGAAGKAGMKAGDVILSIDGKNAKEFDGLRGAVNALRGQAGKLVRVDVSRTGEEAPLTFNLVRKKVDVNPVTKSLIRTPKGNIGLITLSEFTGNADRHFIEAAEALKSDPRGAPFAFILNMRSNPGGLVTAVQSIADDMLESGEVMFRVERGGLKTNPYNAHPGDILDGKPLIVLIDSRCASACEILSGDLKDNGRALVMSKDPHSFGKGSGQSLWPLAGGDYGGMSLTTFYFSTPRGSPHKVGVVPDIKVDLSEAGRPKPDIPPDASAEEIASIKEDFQKFMSRSEASLQNVLPGEEALLRKDAPPGLVCRVAPDRADVHYSVARADIVSATDVVDEVLACAIEKLAGISERAAFTPAAPAPGAP
jgi:carboxyl-terminal processing protease